MATRIHIHQIFHDDVSRAMLDPGFEPLYKPADLRPDWREYWPMRAFLLGQPLAEEHFYGFFSARFKQKTNLDSARVFEFIERNFDAQIVMFSPNVLAHAKFWSVFEQGEHYHPGLKDLLRELVQRAGLTIDLDSIASDTQSAVFSNYFVAKPAFWRRWLALNERLFAAAEDSSDDWGERLRAHSRYRGTDKVPMKVFAMERTPSIVLACHPELRAAVFPPFATPRRARKLPFAIVADALKIAYRATGASEYKSMYRALQAARRWLETPLWWAARSRGRSGEAETAAPLDGWEKRS